MRVSVRLSVFCVVLPVMFSPSFAAFSVYTMASISFAFFAFHFLRLLWSSHPLFLLLASSPPSPPTTTNLLTFFSNHLCPFLPLFLCFVKGKLPNRRYRRLLLSWQNGQQSNTNRERQTHYFLKFCCRFCSCCWCDDRMMSSSSHFILCILHIGAAVVELFCLQQQ